MAGNIDGYFHDNVLVRGSEMAKLTNALAGNRSFVVPNYAQGMNIIASGLNVTIQPGFAVIQGHPVVIKQPMMLSLPANSTVYLVITIDKSKDVSFEGDPNEAGSYTWENNQVALEYVTTLVDGNLNNEDSLFTFQLAKVVTTATTATIEKSYDNYSFSPTKKLKITTYDSNGSYFDGISTVPFGDYWDRLKKLTLVWGGYRPGEGGKSYGFRSIDYDKKTIEELSGVSIWEPMVAIATGVMSFKSYTFNASTKILTGNDNNKTGDNRNQTLKSVWAEVYI